LECLQLFLWTFLTGLGWGFGRWSPTALYFTKSGIIKYMMPQQPQSPQGAPGGGAAPGPSDQLGMIAMKLGPQVLGNMLMALLTKAGLPPNVQGLEVLLKGPQSGGAPAASQGPPQMQTPSAQPGIIR
jgi:hypothetical protein